MFTQALLLLFRLSSGSMASSMLLVNGPTSLSTFTMLTTSATPTGLFISNPPLISISSASNLTQTSTAAALPGQSKLPASTIILMAVIPTLAVTMSLGAIAVRLIKNRRERQTNADEKKGPRHWEVDAVESALSRKEYDRRRKKTPAELETVERPVELDASSERRAGRYRGG